MDEINITPSAFDVIETRVSVIADLMNVLNEFVVLSRNTPTLECSDELMGRAEAAITAGYALTELVRLKKLYAQYAWDKIIGEYGYVDAEIGRPSDDPCGIDVTVYGVEACDMEGVEELLTVIKEHVLSVTDNTVYLYCEAIQTVDS